MPEIVMPVLVIIIGIAAILIARHQLRQQHDIRQQPDIDHANCCPAGRGGIHLSIPAGHTVIGIAFVSRCPAGDIHGYRIQPDIDDTEQVDSALMHLAFRTDESDDE